MRNLLIVVAVLLFIACAGVDQAKVENANKAYTEMIDYMNTGGDSLEDIQAARDSYQKVKEGLSSAEVKAHETFIKERAEALKKEQAH